MEKRHNWFFKWSWESWSGKSRAEDLCRNYLFLEHIGFGSCSQEV